MGGGGESQNIRMLGKGGKNLKERKGVGRRTQLNLRKPIKRKDHWSHFFVHLMQVNKNRYLIIIIYLNIPISIYIQQIQHYTKKSS